MKHRRTLISVIAIILAVMMIAPLLLGAFSMTASAVTSDQLKKELDALKEEAAEIEAKADDLQSQIDQNTSKTQTTVEQKATIDQQMEITRLEMENTNSQIQQYNLLIAEKQKELEAAEDAEAQMNEQFKERIRAMEENGTVSYWSVLFNASSFSDLLDRIDMINEIAESDQDMLEEMAAATEAVAQARADLETEKADLETVKQTLADQQEKLDQQRAEADELLIQLAAESEDLELLYAQYQAEGGELDERIADKLEQYEQILAEEQAAREAAASATTGSSSNSGGCSGFLYPLPSRVAVTCACGYRYHPIYGYYAMHYGVDLGASAGTPIYATKSGTVTTATYGNANGYYVAIDHGDGSSSIYAHMTNYIVSVGQSVSQGEVIGYVGSTGWSTGAHLHFEILIDGANVNPMSYV